MNLSNLFSFQLSAQFGNNGFTPPTGNFTAGANTNEGVISQVSSLISTLLSLSITVAGIILFANFVLASIEWISAGGDSGKIDKAKARLTQSVVGLIILISAVALFMLVADVLGFNFFTFTSL